MLTDVDLLKAVIDVNKYESGSRIAAAAAILRNRYNVILSTVGSPIWMKLGSLVQNNTPHYGDIIKIETGSRIPIWRKLVSPKRK